MQYKQTIAFRIDPDVLEIIRKVADERFGGTVSKLLNTWLKDRLQREGYLPKSTEEENIYRLVREASESGVDVAALLKATMRKDAA